MWASAPTEKIPTQKGAIPCRDNILLRIRGISVSWRILTRAKPPPPSGSCSTPAAPTDWARPTRARLLWTGWSRSRSAASPSRLPPPPAFGSTAASISSTPRGMWTSPLRWSAASACWTVPLPCCAPRAVSSPRPRRSGARPINTTCPVWFTSTRWTSRAQTSSTSSR